MNQNINQEADYDFLQFQQEQKQKLLKSFYLVILALFFVSFLSNPIFLLFFQSGSFLILVSFDFFIGVMFGIGYWLSLKRKLQTASWILVVNLFFGIIVTAWLFGTSVPVSLAYSLAIIIALIFLSKKAAIGFTVLSVFFAFALVICQDILQIYKPNLLEKEIQSYFSALIICITLPTLVALLNLIIKHQTNLASFQNKRLQLTLNDLKERQHTNSLTSQQILAIVSQLNSAATQQSSGSNQQVSTVSEIAQAIEELSYTAASISDIAGQVNTAAAQIDRQSGQIEETTILSVDRSTIGLSSLQETVVASSSVAQRYQLLLQAMQSLTTKSQDMRRILELLSNIASETHLLSLNAAIEAAGAAEYGIRFAVVAQETKNLAMRSGEAGNEVVGIINQIEETINTTLQIAQEGYLTALQMQTSTNQTNQVMDEMGAVVKTAYEQANSIRQGVKGVLELAYTIKLATNQQQTASQQVLQSARELTAGTEQFAHNSKLVSSSADTLENLSSNLSLALIA